MSMTLRKEYVSAFMRGGGLVAPLEGLTDVIATSLAEIGGCRLPKRGPHFLIKRNGRPDVRHLSIITKEGSNFWMPREMITKTF